jgi:hypothetical protein
MRPGARNESQPKGRVVQRPPQDREAPVAERKPHPFEQAMVLVFALLILAAGSCFFSALFGDSLVAVILSGEPPPRGKLAFILQHPLACLGIVPSVAITIALMHAYGRVRRFGGRWA